MTTLLALIVAPVTANAGEYVQIGTGSTSPGTAAGVSSHMTQPNTNYSYTSIVLDHFYWPGATFADGTFLQAGYRDAGSASDCAAFQWFTDYFDNGTEVLRQVGTCGGLSGTKTFALADFGWFPSQMAYKWQWKVGATLIGSPIYTSQSTFPSHNAGVVSEASTTTSFATPGLAQVTYDPAVRIRLSDGTWKDLANVHVYRANTGDFSTPCPPYNLMLQAVESVVVGDAIPNCKANGSPLW